MVRARPVSNATFVVRWVSTEEVDSSLQRVPFHYLWHVFKFLKRKVADFANFCKGGVQHFEPLGIGYFWQLQQVTFCNSPTILNLAYGSFKQFTIYWHWNDLLPLSRSIKGLPYLRERFILYWNKTHTPSSAICTCTLSERTFPSSYSTTIRVVGNVSFVIQRADNTLGKK